MIKDALRITPRPPQAPAPSRVVYTHCGCVSVRTCFVSFVFQSFKPRMFRQDEVLYFPTHCTNEETSSVVCSVNVKKVIERKEKPDIFEAECWTRLWANQRTSSLMSAQMFRQMCSLYACQEALDIRAQISVLCESSAACSLPRRPLKQSIKSQIRTFYTKVFFKFQRKRNDPWGESFGNVV